MPKFTIPAGMKVADAFTDFKGNVRGSYTARANDYIPELYPNLTFDPKKQLSADNVEAELQLKPDDGKTDVTVEGMPIGLFENELTVQLWKPVTIRGYAFNVGDNVTLDQTKIKKTAGVGGNYAWLFATQAQERTGNAFEASGTVLPPPLVREGKKVQTPWFDPSSSDPYIIRPAAQLRMPRFHYGKAEGVQRMKPKTWPIISPPATAPSSPTRRFPSSRWATSPIASRFTPSYLGAGWSMMANKGSPCIQCHAIGPFKPTGGDQVVNGPDLRQVATRFRPGFLETWIANPKRLVPYTAMPQNVVPHGPPQIPVPKTFENQPLRWFGPSAIR